MAQIEREYLHLSSGLDYMEFHYFDTAGNPCDEKVAEKCIIYECDKEGNVLRKVEGNIKATMKKSISQKLAVKGIKLKEAIKKKLPGFMAKEK